MNNQNDIERINRVNFRASLEALSRPGQIEKIQPLFGSTLQAVASVLLYSEVSFCYQGKVDFQMVQAICGAKERVAAEADYLFFDCPESDFLFHAKVGSAENPELGATLIFQCDSLDSKGTSVTLSGPGIETTVATTLPVDGQFIKQLSMINDGFPMGIDLFFISKNGELLGLPRTTKIEVAS